MIIKHPAKYERRQAKRKARKLSKAKVYCLDCHMPFRKSSKEIPLHGKMVHTFVYEYSKTKVRRLKPKKLGIIYCEARGEA